MLQKQTVDATKIPRDVVSDGGLRPKKKKTYATAGTEELVLEVERRKIYCWDGEEKLACPFSTEDILLRYL